MIEHKSILSDKKEWNMPELVSLDFKNTEQEKVIGGGEDGTYQPDSQ
jgi:hypothetical protein